ncbi:MAG: DUF975 family protein [Acetatifactor sp.]|nr:DUF975 family protein [Acetatifactor sp.]
MQYKTNSELKNNARIKLTGNYGTAILATIIVTISIWVIQFPFLIVNNAVSMIMASLHLSEELITGFENIFTYATNFFLSFIGAMFNLGTSLLFLEIASGKRHNISDVFFGFKWQVPKNVRLSLILTVINWICMIPYYTYTQVNPNFLNPEIALKSALLLSVCNIVYILVTIPISQVYFLLLDFPNKDAKEVLTLSIEKMKIHSFRYIKLLLSFIPMGILAVLSCGIGIIWLVPYMNVTKALFFLDMMNPDNKSASESDAEPVLTN